MLDQLEALAALARDGSMAKAGAALRVSQSAVSKRLAGLEGHLGRRLLVREGRRALLTAEGRRVLAETAPLLAELRAVLAREQAAAATALKLGVSESLLGSWGAGALREVRNAMPALALEIHAHRSPMVLERVRSGEYAAGLVAGACERAPELEAVALGEEPMVLLLCGLRGAARSTPGRPLLTIEVHSATWESIARRARTLRITPTMRLESFFCVGQMALAGFGDGLVPLGVARALGAPAARIRRLPRPGLARPLSLVARRTTMARPTLRELSDRLRLAVATQVAEAARGV